MCGKGAKGSPIQDGDMTIRRPELRRSLFVSSVSPSCQLEEGLNIYINERRAGRIDPALSQYLVPIARQMRSCDH